MKTYKSRTLLNMALIAFGTRVRFSQTYKGIPVLNSGYLVAIDEQNRIYFISGDYYPELEVDVTQSLPAGDVTSIVHSDLAGATITYTGKAELFILPEVDDTNEKYTLVYQLDVSTKGPTGDWRYLVDAVNGKILVKRNRILHVNGNGDVYETNPLPNRGGVVNRTIHRLRDISPRRLDGDNVIVFNSEDDEAESDSATFVYSPSNTHFDEVMAYYHSDEFEAWLINPVGMETNRVPRVTIRVQNQDELINGNPAYAHYHPPDTGSTHEIHYGDGSNYTNRENPTKEAAVIAYEYMHRVSQTYNALDQSNEADAMDEAYSDYFAVGYTNQFFSDSEIGEYAIPNTKRDLDNSRTYSEFRDWANQQHFNSVILSGALWDTRNDIGSSTADESILVSLDLLDNSPSFLDARNALKVAAPSQYSDGIDDAFAAHRIPLLTAYIWGPGLVYPGQQNTWDAGSDGDLGSISYQWYIKYSGSSTWTYLGSGSSVTQTFYQQYTTHQFKLVINSNGQSAEDLHTVLVWGGGFKAAVDSIQTETAHVPAEFALHQNYPNPFNPTTEIKFALPENGHVTLSIFNVMGQKIRTLVDEQKTDGYHSIIWDSKDDFWNEVASGIYVYRIYVRANEAKIEPFESVKKMTLLR